jgi:uncharacterized protein (TIGR02271 family)
MLPTIMQGVTVITDDGVSGTVIEIITDESETEKAIIRLSDGARLVVPRQYLTPQYDGSFRIAVSSDVLLAASGKAPAAGTGDWADLVGVTVVDDEVMIPVIAEELTVETQLVERGRVRVTKRIETREETVDAPITTERVIVERLALNRILDEEDLPEVRQEGDVLIIPLIEEVLVVEKRYLLREEVRVFKERTTTSHPQTIALRREVVDVERLETDATASLDQ